MTLSLPAPLNSGLESAVQQIHTAGGAVALLDACLQRIHVSDSRLGCITLLNEQAALEAAAELDGYHSRGMPALPLHGIPVLVKEIISVNGMPHSAASRMNTEDLFRPEGWLISRLRSLGCIILGKTVSTEFALAQFNTGRPMPVNPVAPDRVTGGSSCGSAAAMAAGYCGFTVGTDTGGSVRAPAAFCGVTGFKPTAGAWPMDGIWPLATWLDSPGIFTRSLADAITVFENISAGPAIDRSLQQLRLGIPGKPFFDDLDSVVAGVTDEALDRLRAAGIELVQIELPSMQPVAEYFSSDVPQELMQFLGRERFQQGAADLEPLTAARFAAVAEKRMSAQGREALVSLREQTGRVMQQAGIRCWLSPTVPCVAPLKAELADTDQLLRWQSLASRNTRCINALGMTAISLPLAADLPCGLQLAAGAGDEQVLLATGAHLEACLAPI